MCLILWVATGLRPCQGLEKNIIQSLTEPNATTQNDVFENLNIPTEKALQGKYGQSLVAYDCQNPVITAEYSLHEVENCNLDTQNHQVTDVQIFQIVQRRKYGQQTAINCHVTRDYQIFTCDYHWSAIPATEPIVNELVEVSTEECREMFETRKYTTPNGKKVDVSANSTTHIITNVLGYLDGSYYCYGEPYTNPDTGKYYDYTVILARYHVALYESRATYTEATGAIRFDRLDAQFECEVADESCVTEEAGTFVWDYGKKECNFDALKTFKGYIHTTDNNMQVVVSTDGSINFFGIKKKKLVCGQEMWQTNYERIFLNPILEGVKPWIQRPVMVKNVDLFVNLEVKLEYTWNKQASKSVEMYQYALQKICQLERKIILTKIKLMQALPENSELTVIDRPGTYGRIMGETLYEFTCQRK